MSKSCKFGATQITLKGCDMIINLFDVSLKILMTSTFRSSIFLSTPSNKSQSSFWPKAIFQEKSKRFKYSDESSPIIVGSSL
jgi:hypothetical protein